MPTKAGRADALSKERIVEAAMAILDADGEDALTFRALAARLATGSGAIYWHVADKNALLAAAADRLVTSALPEGPAEGDPREAIRAIALGVFDVFDTHAWLGAQLAREPWQPAMSRIFEAVGGCLEALGVAESEMFDGWSALVNYILGVAGQNAANARRVPAGTDRAEALGAIAAQWAKLDAGGYPFLRRIASRLRDHDDREQFLAGVDLILAGIETINPRKLGADR